MRLKRLFFGGLSGLLLVSLILNVRTSIVNAGSFPGINGRIAYSTYSTSLPSSMKADGSSPVTLADLNALGVSYSPDGTKIAFARTTGDSQVYVANANGSNVVQLTTDDLLYSSPTWSPDGQTIVYTAFESGVDSYHLVYRMDADGSNQTLLADVGTSPSDLTFSPDGTKIAYVASLGGDGNDIYTMNADGSNQEILITGGGHETDPRYSPDGSKIVYSRFDNADYEIDIANADGSNAVQLTNNGVTEFSPTFSPDGTKIAYTQYSGGSSEFKIYTMNIDGSHQTELADTVVHAQIDWQPLTLEPVSSNANPTITIENGTATVNIPSLYTDPYGAGIDNSTVTVTTSPTKGTTSVDSSTGVITYTQSTTASHSLFSTISSFFFPKVSAQSVSQDSFDYQVCSQTNNNLCSSGTITVNLTSSILASTGNNARVILYAASVFIVGGVLIFTCYLRKTIRI